MPGPDALQWTLPPLVKPRIDELGVPWCVEGCPSMRGPHCRTLGAIHTQVCEPAVREMAKIVALRLTR